jgi:hypothetical protein
VLRRSLAAQDTARRISFPTAEPIPVAFFAWDGTNNETGGRGSISSWYFVHLEQPATASVFVIPIVAALITAALGLLVVSRAQKQHRTGAAPQQGGAQYAAPVAAGYSEQS